MVQAEYDDHDKRAENCLAKAGYCRFVASNTADQEFRKYCMRLSAEWQEEARREPHEEDQPAG
jgi:hypothetical protein